MISLKGQRVLVVAPHPDDEVLGCGGLIHKVKSAGGKVFVLYLTVGDTRDFTKRGLSTKNERIEEIKKVAKFLKYDGWEIAYPGNQYHLRLDTVAQLDMINMIERGTKISLQKIRPTMILTPQIADYNQDHQAATDAVFSATRPAPDTVKSRQKIVLGYESVPANWSTRPVQNPNFFVELSPADWAAKLKALSLYKSQVRTGNHLRSAENVRNLARIRGAQSGCNAAEAFYSYRIIA
jgi:LmbE family N-acetylglucosaminyl deacetylase